MKSQWIDTATMAAHLGVHPKTLKRLKNTTAMFEEGIDYRFAGASTRAPLQWHLEATEQSFTHFKRIDPAEVETYGGGTFKRSISGQSITKHVGGLNGI